MLAKSATFARHLRKNPTLAERELWRALRGGAIDGLKFRRQHPIDRYVTDFACVALKLVVEVDGGVHDDDDQALHDVGRTAVIERLGWQVLRVTNADVLANLDGVVARIRDTVRQIRGG